MSLLNLLIRFFKHANTNIARFQKSLDPNRGNFMPNPDHLIRLLRNLADGPEMYRNLVNYA
jgi:hypothetical protein